jgi:hypothetical protein
MTVEYLKERGELGFRENLNTYYQRFLMKNRMKGTNFDCGTDGLRL